MLIASAWPFVKATGRSVAQLHCAREECFCSRGLKEGIFSEAVEKRVLHSTYRATLYLTASIAPVSPLQYSLNAQFPSVPKNIEQIVHWRRNIKASDGSLCFPENAAYGMEGQRFTPVDCALKVHNKVKIVVGCGYAQQKQENFSHVSAANADDVLVLIDHSGASLSTSSHSYHHSSSSKFASLQALHIPSTSAQHSSCDEMQQANELCVEDPEAPSTPDLQPEVRSWHCEAPCTLRADQMLPPDSLCLIGANDLVSGGNPCNKDTDDMLPAHTLLLREEDIVSTCIVPCPVGRPKDLHALMIQGEDTRYDYGDLLDLSFKCSSTFLCDNSQSANSKKASRKLNSSAHRQYMVQWLFYCLMISAQSMCAAPNKKNSHVKSMHTLKRFIRFLKWEGLNCGGELIFEQLFAEIQILLRFYKTSLISDHSQKSTEGFVARCHSMLPAHEQFHVMIEEYADRNGHCQKVDRKFFLQEEMLAMLQGFSQTYFARIRRNHFWLRCLYLEQDIVGNGALNQCSSRLPSKLSTVSASNTSNLLETKNGRFSISTEQSSDMMHDFEENFSEPCGSSSWKQENGSIKTVGVVMDNWNIIPIEQVGECLNTCHSHLQACPSAFPSDLNKLLELSPVKKQAEALNVKCSNGSISDEGEQDHLVCTNGNRDKASCLQMSVVDERHNPTLSQCSSSLGSSMEVLKSSMLHGRVHERQIRGKLEHFAEVFLLRRHIIQQQRRAQRAPPYPCRQSVELAAAASGSTSTGSFAGGEPSSHTNLTMNARVKSVDDRNHEPMLSLTSSLTKPCDVTLSICDQDNCSGADVVIDIVGLAKYLESHSSQLETLTDSAVNSISCTQMPFTGGQSVIPNVNVMIVTILAVVVYTRILLEGAFAWVGSRKHSKEEK